MNKLIIMLLLSMVLIVGCQAEDTEMKPAEAEVQMPESAEITYEPGTWISDYQLALNLSEELSRPVLINFTGSDWCPSCFKLRDEVFVQPEFLDYAKSNLILLTIDFPSKKKLPPAEAQANQALAEQFGIQGFPTILLINSQEDVIAQTGYQQGGAGAYVQHLQDLLPANQSDE